MAIIRLPIVELSTISPSPPYLRPVQSLTGGLIAMLFAVSGKPYRLVGFNAGLNAGNASSGAGPTTWLDGYVKVPIQILVPPTFDPIAKGILELAYLNGGPPPTISVPGAITAYAELHGVIYPGVSQVVAAFNLPNTATFTMGSVNQAALIVEDYQEGHEWRV
jgi:hypothetical protein